ncbi:uncharacterized protein DS421_15g521700 [Arachis hypogaea]|nr:uncharacterized protein DS421_15g521700 [Arachis hypogaea]
MHLNRTIGGWVGGLKKRCWVDWRRRGRTWRGRGWAPETLLGRLEAARSQVAWSEVAPETLLGGGWVVHRRWRFSSVRRWDLEELRKASI